MTTNIRPAIAADASTILNFIRDLADYEKLLHEVFADEASIKQSFFCEQPKAFALILEADAKPVGFAVYFYNYSTFLGRHGIYLEDVYVDPACRGSGLGKAVFQYLADKAIAEGCGRLDWSVLDWNEPAIKFYEKLGAETMTGWLGQRLSGNSLQQASTHELKKAS